MPTVVQAGTDVLAARQQRFRVQLERRGLPIFVVTNPVNIFYLTGFRGTAGVAVFERSEALLWVDPRYTLQARQQAEGAEVIEAKTGLFKAVGRWLKKRKPRLVGYEDSHLSCAGFKSLEHESPPRMRYQAAGGVVEELRTVKDPYEIDRIRQAGHLTAACLTEMIPRIRPGMCESDVAAELDYQMRRGGADGAAFETIVASGARAALPHARASGKQIAAGELVILDLGAILGGYAADMTRTLYLGRPGPRVRNLFKAVVEAQQEAAEAARPGARAGDVDAIARRCLKRRGLADLFTHSTGHGVGLEVHEKPRLGKNVKTRLRAGFVVTAEPGLYVEGFGGVRMEDTVLVGTAGPEILTPAAKEPWFIE